MTDGFKAKSFKGIPIAIEHHADGSVTICKEIRDDIRNSAYVPQWIKDLMCPPPNGVMYFTSEIGKHG